MFGLEEQLKKKRVDKRECEKRGICGKELI